ncbi:DNA ligase 1-like protein [Cinnamomum micranthum f. kanehirae]|uniref:DNA ligase 1-like protein n=1 Tax=Cinnamomum micranthum f. kanehirae TaxID=337451 RepID=A0A3S3R1L4_9MAGN|nr:DNA ligase 1-like protein [Cinnamomum micranthum f. kanehirae]
MASSSSFRHFRLRRSLYFWFVFFLCTSLFVLTVFAAQPQKNNSLGRRILATEKEEESKKKENQSKPIKISTNSTTKAAIEKKNQFKATTNSTRIKTTLFKTKLNNLTSTLNSSKPTKLNSISIKKSEDLIKSSTPKDKTTSTKSAKLSSEKRAIETKTLTNEKLDPLEEQQKSQQSSDKKAKDQKTIKEKGKSQYPGLPYTDGDEDDGFIAEFRDLPYKFHEAILPDLEKISTTSKAYISIANKEIAQGFKPIVGNKYASSVASFTSFIFLFLPLLLVSLLFNQIRAYISLQKILIFIQVYLAVYFATLSLAYFATGLEPLKFFYATSTSSYMAMQVFQTLGYVMYLLMQLLNLVVVFSAKDSGVGLKFLGLAQSIVGLAVGFHYYAAVFHRVVVGKPPKTNWKIHGIYAMCFIVICLFAKVERRKKAYVQEGGGDDGKKS